MLASLPQLRLQKLWPKLNDKTLIKVEKALHLYHKVFVEKGR